jgi:hypothetical protein
MITFGEDLHRNRTMLERACVTLHKEEKKERCVSAAAASPKLVNRQKYWPTDKKAKKVSQPTGVCAWKKVDQLLLGCSW